MGTFIFASFVNWAINARSIYPMLPAVAILVTGKLENRKMSSDITSKSSILLPLVPALMISISVGWADATFADCQREAADMIQEKFQKHVNTIWFQGHWGFQYYMELYGAKPIVFNKSEIGENDIVVIPLSTTKLIPPIIKNIKIIHKLELMSCRWIATMSTALKAGFYWDGAGCLPYAIGNVEPEQYLIYRPVSESLLSENKTHYKNNDRADLNVQKQKSSGGYAGLQCRFDP